MGSLISTAALIDSYELGFAADLKWLSNKDLSLSVASGLYVYACMCVCVSFQRSCAGQMKWAAIKTYTGFLFWPEQQQWD